MDKEPIVPSPPVGKKFIILIGVMFLIIFLMKHFGLLG